MTTESVGTTASGRSRGLGASGFETDPNVNEHARIYTRRMGMRKSPGRGLPRARRAVVAVLMVLISALTLSACGSSDSDPSPSAASEASLLGPSDFEKYPEDSVERDLLEYWSNLQFRSWADVATYYDPRFRDFVGTT